MHHRWRLFSRSILHNYDIFVFFFLFVDNIFNSDCWIWWCLWTVVVKSHIIDIVTLLVIIQTIAYCILIWRHNWCRCTRWWWMHWEWWSTCCFFCRIHICFFLSLANILLVANSFISKPIANLRDLRMK